MARPSILTTASGTRPGAFGPGEWGLLSAVAVIWGSSFLLIDIGLDAFHPGLISLLRMLFGILALAFFRTARGSLQKSDWPRVAVLGLTWMAIPLLLFPIAQQWISSSVTGMLNGSMPLFSALIASLLLRRIPNWKQALGLFVGFGGVVLISWPSLQGSAASIRGALLILLATMFYGLSANLAVPLQQRYGALPVLLRVQMVAFLMILPFGLGAIGSSTWSSSAFAAVAVLGVLGTGVAFAAMATLVGKVGATRGSVAVYFLPPVAIVLGVVFRQETVTGAALAGTALVLLGAYLASRKET